MRRPWVGQRGEYDAAPIAFGKHDSGREVGANQKRLWTCWGLGTSGQLLDPLNRNG